MITFPYKTRLLHDHICDRCLHLFKDMCQNNCHQKDELCPGCKEEYKIWLERQERMR